MCWDAQDLTIHRAEVHAKLVAIMRERLNANLKQLPAIADAWGAAAAATATTTALQPPPASSFALANAKQLRILRQVRRCVATSDDGDEVCLKTQCWQCAGSDGDGSAAGVITVGETPVFIQGEFDLLQS